MILSQAANSTKRFVWPLAPPLPHGCSFNLYGTLRGTNKVSIPAAFLPFRSSIFFPLSDGRVVPPPTEAAAPGATITRTRAVTRAKALGRVKGIVCMYVRTPQEGSVLDPNDSRGTPTRVSMEHPLGLSKRGSGFYILSPVSVRGMSAC